MTAKWDNESQTTQTTWGTTRYTRILGAAAGISATFISHPCDVLRVQLQLRTSTRISLLAKQLYAEAGIRGLYAGISAAWLRQIMYGAPRLGIYSYLYENVCDNTSTPPFLTKLALGLTAGSIGAICGTPAEVALVRMSADAGLPVAKQRGYGMLWTASCALPMRKVC